MYQYSGAGYITVSSRTQDRNTPSARAHRTHGRTQSIEHQIGKNTMVMPGRKNIYIIYDGIVTV